MSRAVDEAGGPAAPILEALRSVIDPELGVDIVELGLVYRVALADDRAEVLMTMTSPTCPAGAQLAREAEAAVRRAAPHLARVDVRVVWDPPWQPSFMSEEAKRRLGWGE